MGKNKKKDLNKMKGNGNLQIAEYKFIKDYGIQPDEAKLHENGCDFFEFYSILFNDF
jgi:hypothetical protein